MRRNLISVIALILAACGQSALADGGGEGPGGAILPPYPPSPVIAGIQWAPLETIVRRAKGSDNFPLTWSDDDGLYTTYGDGLGFEPFVASKLSLGLARITGTPEDLRGVNLRSDSIEQYGGGRQGRKGWGLLSVEGVLYLWLGHADRNGEHGDFPSKWIRDDGRALFLVFSGDDHFCVRKATLKLRDPAATVPPR